MPRFEPFCGIRYDTTRVDLADVLAPPYDVISEDQRALLEARSEYNAVRVDLPRDAAGHDRYTEARCLLDAWREIGVLVTDDEPGFYVYRMGFVDESGRARQTSGVIGALTLGQPGSTDVLPHEQTMPKPKDDRLNLQRSCVANLSAIWGLSLAEGLGSLCELPGAPDMRTTDDDGVHHRLWRITQPGIVDAIAGAVASTPVLIADGHHRYETALAYQAERQAAGAGAGPWDLVMAFVVELSDAQLTVRPIHRVLRDLPAGTDLVDALSPWFEPFPVPAADLGITDRMADAGALGLVTARGAWLLRPRMERFAGLADLDSSRLDAALADLPPHDLAYQHGTDNVISMLEKGEIDAAVLLRPATVAQIAATAHSGVRMPPKTTFFHPKPRTGLVFRSLS